MRAGIAIAMATARRAVHHVPGAAGTYATLSGSGSSWAAVALDQWAQDLQPTG